MKQAAIKGFSLQVYRDGNTQIAYKTLGSEAGPVVLWAHGWGQSHAAFLPLAESLAGMGRHVLVDFPGFGASPPPEGVWGTAEYADFMAGFIRSLGGPVIWVGHSFGCRVGLQMGAKHADLISGLFLIAAAGLPRKRPLHKKLYIKARVALFKFLKKITPAHKHDALYKKFGSSDYRNAGVLRQILVKTINENLSGEAKQVTCPVTLAYGTADNETPLDVGIRLNKLIKGSELLTFDALDHYSILGAGRHQVAPYLKTFIEAHAHG